MSFEFRKVGATAAVALAAIVLATGPAFAQGTQSGVLTGVVSSSDGAPLPGVTVTLSSPVLQGDRTVTTDSSGAYIFRGLPPGQYKVSFALTGFATLERSVGVALAGTSDVNASLTVATLEETVEVTAVAPSILTTPQVAANYRAEMVDKLAMNRNLAAFAELAPGVNDNGPNIGQVSIAGSFAYDNVFLLNGVDINDNLFGTANNLFIEDAIQEVQILSSGISAEFGRFSGGVINAVTKSGGNTFFGSFRTELENAAWRDESRFQKDRISAGRGRANESKTNLIHQATLGGPFVKDRLWFFLAGRREATTTPRNLTLTGGGYDFDLKNNRIEAKLTGALNPNHNLQATYIRNSTDQINNASINTALSIDARTLVTRNLPNDLFVANYTGVLSSNLFVEGQYSQKNFGFRNTGGTSRDIKESPFLAQGRTGIGTNSHYNAPYFSSFDPEDRNNKQYSASLSYFLSTGSAGRHDLKVGGEHFTSTRTGGNSQSATGYVFQTDPLLQGGQPVVGSDGRFIPVFTPGVSRIQNWLSVQGAQIDITTLSFYVNDRWALNNRWSFNVGGRFERRSTNATQAEVTSITSTALVPRLSTTFDVRGDGEWILQGTYGHYAGKASETQFADNTNVGTPSLLLLEYTGPAGQGIDFDPAFDLSNYRTIGGNFPVNNVFLDEGLETPITKEWTVQAGKRLGSKGEAKVVYTNRSTSNFLEDFILLESGKTRISREGLDLGEFDNVIIRNTDVPARDYQALLFMTNYRLTDRWSVLAHYTLQLKNEGNFEGEAANQPGISSIILDRPEFYSEARHYPVGPTDDYQQHKVRVFTTYDVGLGAAGTATLGMLYRYDSAQAYSLIANNVPFTPEQIARDPGYARRPTTQANLFFAPRGSERFEESHVVDLALNYEIPVYRQLRPWFKAEVRNVFNTQPLIGFDTTISPDPNSPKDELGLATGYTEGANFGKPTVDWDGTGADLPRPREFRFSVGFRF